MIIEAIASRAGIGKTTIYRRYTSKEELVADTRDFQLKKYPIAFLAGEQGAGSRGEQQSC